MCLGIDRAKGRLCRSLKGVGDVSLLSILPLQSLALSQFSRWGLMSLFRRDLVIALHSSSHCGTGSFHLWENVKGVMLWDSVFLMLSACCLLGSSWSLYLPFFFGVCNKFAPVSTDGCLSAQSMVSHGCPYQPAPSPYTKGGSGRRNKQLK